MKFSDVLLVFSLVVLSLLFFVEATQNQTFFLKWFSFSFSFHPEGMDIRGSFQKQTTDPGGMAR